MLQFKFIKSITILIVVLLIGCVTSPPPLPNASPLTQGNVQLTLVKGETTQNQVLQSFGPPNVSTINAEGQEIWTYQRMAIASSSGLTSNAFTVILFSNTSAREASERSQSTTTLIITFEKGTVSDYRSLSTQF